MKIFKMSVVLFVITMSVMKAQNYNLEFVIEGRLQYMYTSDWHWLDRNSLDMDFDNIPEICVKVDSVINIYDGSTKLLKHQINLGEIFEYPNSLYLYGFYDIDGDEFKEALLYSHSGNLYLIDLQQNTIEFTAPGQAGFSIWDIDNDGLPELLVCRWVEVDYVTYIWGADNPTALNKDTENTIRNNLLHQNYPNPFNPSTQIKYQVQKPSNVSIIVYNSLGQKVKGLVDEFKNPGEYIVDWNGIDDRGGKVATGIYFYQLTVGDFRTNKKMIYLK